MKTKILTLLMSLMTMTSLYSQDAYIRRIRIHDSTANVTFTRRFSSEVLTFKSPLASNDSIYLGIMSDSVDTNLKTLNLYSYFPRNINPINATIIFVYTDEMQDILIQRGFPDENNYVEYTFVGSSYDVRYKKLKTIIIRDIGRFDVKNKSYVIKFSKILSL